MIGLGGSVIKNLYGPGGYDPADDCSLCVLDSTDNTDIFSVNRHYADYFEKWKNSAEYDERLMPAFWIDWKKETEGAKL